jgi:hypothetical protein
MMSVQIGTANTAKVDAPATKFPGESSMKKIIALDEGTDGLYVYEFYHFDCLDTDTSAADNSSLTCLYYNISSSSTEILPVENDDYSIDLPESYF